MKAFPLRFLAIAALLFFSSMFSNEPSSAIVSKKDSLDSSLKRISVTAQPSDGRFLRIRYDKEKRVISQSAPVGPNNKKCRIYDRLASTLHYSPQGQLLSKVTFRYDGVGHTTQERHYAEMVISPNLAFQL